MSSESRAYSPASEDIANQQVLLVAHRQTLLQYMKQEAALGKQFIPPGVANGINEARSEIQRIKAVLRSWNVPCADHPDDEPARFALTADRSEPLPSSPVKQVSDGLNALADLMDSPDVHSAVAAFRTEFFVLRDQIAKLADYKALHDQLHDLQFHCYNVMVSEIKRLPKTERSPHVKQFPDDQQARENLSYYEQTFAEIVEKLQKILARSNYGRVLGTGGATAFFEHEREWVQDLHIIQTNFRIAIDQMDSKLLNDVMLGVSRVLAIRPTRINAQLNTTARGLRLHDLIEALTSVSQILARPDFNRWKVEQFTLGLHAITAMRETLLKQIHKHDCWQEVDAQLRRIDGLLAYDIGELETSWPHLRQQVDKLCDTQEEWVAALQQEDQNLHKAIADQDTITMRKYFYRYYTKAGWRFYQVDTELKMLCDDLRGVGEPLALMLRIIP